MNNPLKAIREFRVSIAIIGILSVATVFGWNFLCELDLISFSFTKHTEASEEGEHHSSKHHHPKSAVQSESTTSHHDNSSKEGCCEDLTKRFYSSLANQTINLTTVVPVQTLKLILTIVFGNEISFINRENLIVSKFDHPPNGPPEITGRLIRVHILSFLI